MIYTRVSRDDTGEGRSNTRQREDCEKLAELRGWEVVEVCEDISISAYGTRQRPAWQRVLQLVEDGEVEVVLAWHIDRMTRNMADLEHMITLAEEHGVGIATVTGDIDLTTDVGRMVARILAAVARAEVERKGARQRRANQQRAAEGQPWRARWRPFGYTRDGELIEREAELIAEAAERVLAGDSLYSIARWWKEEGVSTPRSSKGANGWTHRGVRSILLNPRNAAIATYHGEVVGKGNWPAIFSEATHTLLVAKLTDPARLTRKDPVHHGKKPQNLLTGIAQCSVCDAYVEAGSGYKGVLTYQCASYHISTPRTVDELVRSAFAATVSTMLPGKLIELPPDTTAPKLTEEAARLRERLDLLSTSYASGGITIEQLETASKMLREQLAQIETQTAEVIRLDSSPWGLRAEAVTDFLDGTLEQQRAALTQLATIRLLPRGRGRRNVPIKEQVSMTVEVDGKTINVLKAEAPRGKVRP